MLTRAFCSTVYVAIGFVVLYAIYEWVPTDSAPSRVVAPALAAIGACFLAGLDSLPRWRRPFAFAPVLGAAFCGVYLVPAVVVGFIALLNGQGAIPAVSQIEVWSALGSEAGGFLVLFAYFVVTLLVWNRENPWHLRIAAAIGPALLLTVLALAG